MGRDVLGELLDSLRLERIEEHLFRGPSQDLGWGRVFGGQVLGQVLSAARQTVPPHRHVHSVHAYFLRGGDVDRPVVYTVDPIRDGGSFTTRRVVAIQHGRPIFNLSASFHHAEPGMSHHDDAPSAPGPEGLLPESELGKRYLEGLPEALRQSIPPLLRERVSSARPIEIRPVAPIDPIRPDVRPPHRQVWFRAARTLPDELAVHQYLLAYASDFQFLATAMQPHGVSWLTPGIQSSSLDHAMWFHRPFRMDQWLLYDIHSPSTSGARGLVHGRFFQEGVLVASVMQEGLVRDRRGGK